MLALLGALKEEVVDLQKHMILEEALAWQDCHIYKGKHENSDILLVQTGIGKKRAEIATKFILERYPVTMLISLGFAGALTKELKVADVIICSTLHCADGFTGRRPKLGEAYSSDASLVSLVSQSLEGTGIRFGYGNSVTVAEAICTAEAKRTLGKAFCADIVDMESYWIARIAASRRIPFIAVRSISDILQDSLPPFDQMLTSNGKWQWKKMVPYFLFHPQHLTELFTLYWNTRQARKSLTTFVDCLLTGC